MRYEEILHELAKKGSIEQLESTISALREQVGGDDSESVVRHLLGKRDDKKYTVLQNALFGRNLDIIPTLLAAGCDVNAKCFGTPCIHLAISIASLPEGNDFGISALGLLLKQDYCNILAKDDQLQSALTLACDYDNPHIANMLLTSGLEGASDLLELRDRTKGTALHRCAAKNSVKCMDMLLSGDIVLGSVDSTGNTALHVAAIARNVNVYNMLLKKADKAVKDIRNIFGRTAKEEFDSDAAACVDKRTVIITNEICRQHYTCPPSATDTPEAPPENLRRLSVILDESYGCLRSEELQPHLSWIENCRAASINDVLRVHEWPWVRSLQAKCEALREDADEPGGMDQLDGDTAISRYTFESALCAAGSTCQAVDLIMAKHHNSGASSAEAATMGGDIRNAFCAVRPPGHHAGPKGLVASGSGGPDSHGFCFLNNVSIGAAYALNVHRDHVKKVCIVDFDVHHGNGTEETVRWLRPGVDHATVATNDVFGSLAMPRYKPWYGFDDPENVLFVSVHGFGARARGLEYALPAAAFYPGTGATVIPDLAPPSPLRPNITEAEKQDEAAANTAASSSSSSGIPAPMSVGEKETEIAENDEEAKMKVSAMFAMSSDGDGEGEYEYSDPHVNDDGDDDFSDAEDGPDDDSSDMAPGVDMDGGDKRLEQLRQMFYGGTGKGAGPAAADGMEPLIMDIGVALPPEDDPVGNYRHQWRNYFRDEIFPRIAEFGPDMVFISAGFDAHKRDDINSGYISLVEEDYEWATTHLQRLANSCCDGRLVSVLEGGYQIGGEHMSAFAKSVKAHVSAMTQGARTAARGYSKEDLDAERRAEADIIAAMEARRQAKLEAERQRREQEETAAAAARAARMQEMANAEGVSEEERAYIERVMRAEAEDAAAATTSTAAVAAQDTSSDIQPAKRRRASKPVDYAALDREMREKERAL